MAGTGDKLTLGVIGMSPGNGHPYSWSAIFNGFDPVEMAHCPFPAIPAYLAERSFPQDQLTLGEVTHVWADDPSVASHIASACHVANTVALREDLIGAVDGILLARDDAETHVEMALPFLQAGMSVYVDKPFALSRGEAETMLAAETFEGQLFTGSALLHAEELRLDSSKRESLGKIERIEAVTPKNWTTYAAHIVEPVLAMTRDKGAARVSGVLREEPATTVSVRWADGTSAKLTATGASDTPIRFHVFGEKGDAVLEFRDSFSCFRAALHAFCTGVLERRRTFDGELVLNAVDIIEAGLGTQTT